MTEYIIIRREERADGATGNQWREISPTVKASSARRALAAAEVKAGIYVAVPLRSWKELLVKVEPTTKVTIV